MIGLLDDFCRIWVPFLWIFLACSVRRRRCSLAVFVCSVLGRFSSCRSSLFVVRGKGGHAEHTIKKKQRDLMIFKVGQGGRASKRRPIMT